MIDPMKKSVQIYKVLYWNNLIRQIYDFFSSNVLEYSKTSFLRF